MSIDLFNELLKKYNILSVIKDKTEQAQKSLKTVNILVAGKSGVGKSTLINIVFGKEYAEVGKGRPVTAEIKWYERAGSPLRLCDTLGLELTKFARILQDLKKEIQRSEASGRVEDRIHIAWLCVSEVSDRIEDGEIAFANLCMDHQVPVIVVLTKAISDEEFSEKVSEHIPNAKAVVRVLAEPWKKPFHIEAFGLPELVAETLKLVPMAIEGAFIAAQRIDLSLKRKKGLKIAALSAVAAGSAAAVPIPGIGPGGFITANISMLISIAIALGLELDTSTATAVAMAAVSALGASFAIRTGLGELLKLIPVVGSALGGGLEVATAVSSTYAIGHAFVEFLLAFMISNSRMPNAKEVADEFNSFFRASPKKIQPPAN